MTGIGGASPGQPDVLFVGGGLASCLAAYRTAQRHPDLRLQVLERGHRPGGNHTWSFHEGDLTPAQMAWVEPLVTRSWPRYEVRFPGFRRIIESGYHTIDSEHLATVVLAALGDRVRVGREAAILGPDHVVLPTTGERIAARAVIDGTGFRPHAAVRLGYQKFLGQVLEFEPAIDLPHPIVMDATVDQADGFRFVYVLPFSERRALVEDTTYSDTPDLPTDGLRDRIAAYAAAAGWRVRGVAREETGVLPVTLAGDFDRFWPTEDRVARVGLRAGLYHPTTGYSLPQAVATADLVAGAVADGATDLGVTLRRHALGHWREGGFYRALNRMLLLAGRPADRYRVLERFYGLPAPLIARFYAGCPTLADRIRLVVGSPPVPVAAAVSALFDTALPGPGRPSRA